jgi:hypothetical protein
LVSWGKKIDPWVFLKKNILSSSILSGIDCGKENVPGLIIFLFNNSILKNSPIFLGVYVNIANYVPWIQSTIRTIESMPTTTLPYVSTTFRTTFRSNNSATVKSGSNNNNGNGNTQKTTSTTKRSNAG